MKQSKKAENDILSILLKFFLLGAPGGCALHVSITSDQTFLPWSSRNLHKARQKSVVSQPIRKKSIIRLFA